MSITVKLPVAVSLAVAVGLPACGSGAGETSPSVATQNLSSQSDDQADDDHNDPWRSRRHRRQRGDWRQRNAGAGGGGAGGMATTPIAGNAAPSGASGPQPQSTSHYLPKPGTSWQIQLTGDLDTGVDAQVFDIDLFETSSATISAFHADGKHVICYFDTAYEPGRPDSSALSAYRGNAIDGWPGQSWVDFRQPAVVDVMLARLQLASSKGCDGVDADDVDARDNDPGFPISAADQQNFIITLAEAAHAQGLAYGLKNALDDVPALVEHVDFAVNEECFDYDECDALAPFTQAGKAVFQIEYAESNAAQARASEICPQATALNLDTLIKDLDLDAARYSCR